MHDAAAEDMEEQLMEMEEEHRIEMEAFMASISADAEQKVRKLEAALETKSGLLDQVLEGKAGAEESWFGFLGSEGDKKGSRQHRIPTELEQKIVKETEQKMEVKIVQEREETERKVSAMRQQVELEVHAKEVAMEAQMEEQEKVVAEKDEQLQEMQGEMNLLKSMLAEESAELYEKLERKLVRVVICGEALVFGFRS
jgi:hypothetical protein